MGMEGSGLSVADALALGKNNDGMFGGSGSGAWVFFLFFLLAWGGGGFGFGNRAGNLATQADVQRGFDNQAVINKLNGLENGLCDGFYAMNTGMLNGFSGVNAAIANLGYQEQQCCCTTNRNIDSVKYENAQNTAAIVNASNANTQKILDVITQNQIQDLRDKLQEAQLQNSQCAQNAYLINQLQPVARPAYITCSPYAASGCCNC